MRLTFSRWFYTACIVVWQLYPAKLFDRVSRLDWYKQMLELWVQNLSLEHTSKILDVGTATGYMAAHLDNLGHEIVGIDRSANMIKRAVQRYPAIDFRVLDATNTYFEDCSFDVVLAASVINVVASPKAFVNETIRLCKQTGKVSYLFLSESIDKNKIDLFVYRNGLFGFSEAAFRFWLGYAKKFPLVEAIRLLKDCGIDHYSIHYYLDGMVVALTAEIV
ncbi:MAG: class I SAM-dependent methyltransferase [Sulfuricurvum sp.]|nr:class I SAM-dependent methyltransferase [Sulfuricurvum sp.]